MTPPETETATATEEPETTRPPAAARVAVVATFLVGVGAVGASSVLSSAGARVVLSLAVIAVGWGIARRAEESPVGERVVRATGTSLAVLGAYLFGLALVTASVGSGPAAVAPSPTMVVLLVYGFPTLALLLATATGMRAWASGAGAILPMLAVLLLAASGASAGLVAVLMLGVAVVLLWPAVRTPAHSVPGNLAGAAAAMAASFAFGAGSSPFGSLGTTQLGAAETEDTGGALSGGPQAAVVAGALLVAVVLLVAAVLRRDLATGVLAGSLFATPPLALVADPVVADWPLAVRIVLVAVPLVVALAAAIATRTPPLRTASARAWCAVVVAGAAVALLTLGLPVLGWAPVAQGAVSLVVLVGVVALAYWLPGLPGAAAAVVALLGLAWASPWFPLLGGGLGMDTGTRPLIGALDVGAAAVVVWLLLRRHPRVGVFAASAYSLAASLAAFFGLLLFDPGYFGGTTGPFPGEWAPVLVVGLPLLLLVLPAAALAFGRWAATAQAVGAVALAAAGFVPLKVMAAGIGGSGVDGYGARLALQPLTPTDWLMTSSTLSEVSGTAAVALLLVVLAALVLAASLAGRPSAPLAAAIALVLLATVQAALLTALAEWSADEAETLGWVLGAAALVAGAVAWLSVRVAERR
ncbi:hypothetical protein [Actinophytocola xanthii]|uniref:Uncharacterized protein n=1 Tax=Actinophytocola xanthii TaxID=1912961 RepID=A0A1Q8CL36_9PSEU|nr:hypothetical protein [Actinophytocola xanthii]OLF15070.1 hypothetical protein BU204_23655 [Actinophytocola xanthii]